jgi:carboxypeptidase D
MVVLWGSWWGFAGHVRAGAVDSPNSGFVGRRSGPIKVVEVKLRDRAALDELMREGYNVSNFRDNVAVIYAGAEELAGLRQAGYHYREIEQQGGAEEPAVKDLGVYHDYASLTSELEGHAAAYPGICRLYSLGRSVQDRELWAMLISDNPDDEEDEPEVKYVSTMHGDEPLGTELCLYLIELLLTDYGTDSRITELVDSTVIWIVPLMNPDGLEMGWRYNADGYDLNRSFPAYPYDFTENFFDGGDLCAAGRPAEVVQVMRWTVENSFVLSANFHTGALLVNYPYDDDGKGSVDSPTPDDLLLEEVSRRYSVHNSPMWNSPYFSDGISNGAAWFSITGGMQDWNYRYSGCSEVTIELSDDSMPAEPQIPGYWADNSESMLSYLEAVHIGVRGVVTDRATGEPLWAQVRVEGNAHAVFTDANVGDYHRMLLPDEYDLSFSAEGHVPCTLSQVVVSDGTVTRLDVELATSDISADGRVDYADFARLAAHWGELGCGACGGADLTCDGEVGLDDLRELLANWLAPM